MVEGIERFRDAMAAYADNYIIIGGTACDIVLDGSPMMARPTRDIDLIVVSMGDVDIIVSTLWARISPEKMYYTEHGVNDFYRIRYNGHRLSALDFNEEHERCLRFLKSAVENSRAGTKIISNQLGYISNGEYLKNGFKSGKWFEA